MISGRPDPPIKGSSLLLAHEAFPFAKMIPGMLDPEMIEDKAKDRKRTYDGDLRSGQPGAGTFVYQREES